MKNPLWLLVAEAETKGTFCNFDCEHYWRGEQSEAYSEGHAAFSWWECRLGEKYYHRPEECPFVQAKLDEEEVEVS